ncbi:MAG: hypothetical protein JWN46_2804, partial [Acidimicrobiales bacterium]|nr:hypothetical protein [Acidimicrobiales bacterium]
MPSLLRRRAAAVVVVGGLLVVPLLSVGAAAGDPIGDKKAEASRIADQLQQLANQAEIDAEQYNDAVLHLGQVDADVAAAQARVAAGQKEIAARRLEVARYAVGAYTRGGDDNLSLLLGSDGSDLSQREGYMVATIGNRQDLVEALRVAEAANHDRITDLEHARQAALSLKARIAEKRRAADATTRQLEAVDARVTGELKVLVTAEEARRAAADAVKAQQQALLLAQQQQLAPPPGAPAAPGARSEER